jgi:prepilin-type N-terminal cleavage/methylation domain-containing protein
MRTCSARTPDRARVDKTVCPTAWAAPRAARPVVSRPCGFTLVELIVVISILALFVIMVQVSLFGVLQRSRFKADVQEFVSTMQMAASAAAQSRRRYEVILDIGEQTFLLREISSSNLADVLEEEVVTYGQFGQNCRIAYVEFDDGDYTNEGKAKFRAGHAGWQYGGKVVFLDESEQPYAVVVSRILPIVELVEGDPALMFPKAKDEVPFL